MGIEKLRNSLLSEAKEEAQQIVQTAQSHVQNMLREEKAKDADRKSKAEKEVERTLRDQENERIAWARLEAKRIKAEAKEDAIKNVFENFFNTLSKSRNTPDYKGFLKKAVPEAAADLGGNVTIHCLKEDSKLIPAVKNAKVVTDLEGLGGVLVESSDGKIRVDLTLETLVETRRDEIRKRIAEELFK
jgi:V/A-type H+-transporting ATPase subunit E